MRDEIVFRKASEQDIHHLVQLRIDFLSDYWGNQPEENVLRLKESLFAFFMREMNRDNYVAFIAFKDNKPVSTGAMVISSKPGSFRMPVATCAYIMNMFTHVPYRKKGLAAQILHLLMEEGKMRGVTIFELHATEEGEPLYVKSGFEIHKEPSYRKFIL